jgi:hypothetical protein
MSSLHDSEETYTSGCELQPERIITADIKVFVLQSSLSHWTTSSMLDPTLSILSVELYRLITSFKGCDIIINNGGDMIKMS